MKIETVALSKLNPSKYNPRKDLQPGGLEYEMLKKSILEFGMIDPLVVNERGMVIIGGHQRYKILKELGFTEIEVSLVDYDETKEIACNIALNKHKGDWDLPLLKDILHDLDSKNIDMEIVGFNQNELEGLMTQYHVTTEEEKGKEGKVNKCPKCGYEY